MNYLAHILLPGDNDLLKVGNFLGDFVSSKDQKKFNPEIQKGIKLHHYIDHYTDTHAIVKKSKMFNNVKNNSHLYFVHSYEFIPEDKDVVSATTEYSSSIVCSVEKENIFGTQFHPEKSDKDGLKIIENFINL